MQILMPGSGWGLRFCIPSKPPGDVDPRLHCCNLGAGVQLLARQPTPCLLGNTENFPSVLLLEPYFSALDNGARQHFITVFVLCLIVFQYIILMLVNHVGRKLFPLDFVTHDSIMDPHNNDLNQREACGFSGGENG